MAEALLIPQPEEPNNIVNNKDNNDEAIICCIPFTDGLYNNWLVEGKRIITSNEKFYIMNGKESGQLIMNITSGLAAWSNHDLEEQFINRLMNCLREFDKRHYKE